MCDLRPATLDDIPDIHRVRLSVRENVLTPGRVTEADVHRVLSTGGRGWVVARG